MIYYNIIFFASVFLIFGISFYSQLPELQGNNNNDNQTIGGSKTTSKVCSIVDVLMTYADPNRMIKHYFCFSA